MSDVRVDGHGGPAFPIDPQHGWSQCGGMTLLDYFAAAALTGLLASRDYSSKEDAATDAYEQADAMLKAREL